MAFLRDLAALAALLGAVETLVAVGRRLGGAGVPRPALRLVALPCLGLMAEPILLWTPVNTPTPGSLEQLGVHPVLAPLGWLLAAPGLWTFARRRARRWARWRTQRPARHAAAAWAAWLPALGLVGCWLPPWALDDRLYHLSLPLHRLLGHGPIAGHGNGGFFGLSEATASWALAQASVAAARSQQLWACAWATQALVALLPGAGLATGAWAQVLFLAAPVVVWQLGTGYVDVLVAAHQAVGAALLWHYLEAPRARWAAARLVLAAALFGAAAGTKASALAELLGFFLALGLGLRARARQGTSTPVRWPLAACVAVAGALPWIGYAWRNLWRYHAPLFPFGSPLWPGAAELLPSQREALAFFLRLHGPYDGEVALRGAAALCRLPAALVLDAAFASPRFDGVLGALPALAAVAACWRAWARRGERAAGPEARLRRLVGGLVALRVVVWTSTSWQARFLLGPLWWCAWAVAAGGVGRLARAPAAAVAVGADKGQQAGGTGFWRGAKARADGSGAVWPAALALALTTCFWPSLRGHGPRPELGAFGDAASRRAARLARFAGSALCDANANVSGADGKMLLVWSQRYLLWCLQPVVSDSYDEAASLREALRRHPDEPWAVAAQLRAMGVGTLLVDEALLNFAAPALDPEARALHASERRAYAAFRRVALQEEGRVGSLVRYRLVDGAQVPAAEAQSPPTPAERLGPAAPVRVRPGGGPRPSTDVCRGCWRAG